MKLYIFAIALVTITASIVVGQQDKQPAATKKEITPKTKAAPKKKRAADTGTPPPPVSQAKPLTLTEVADLLTTSPIPDPQCTKMIAAAPLPLPPEEDWVNALMRIRERNQRPACYESLLARVPPGPEPDAVQKAAPAILEEIRALVQAGKKDELIPYLRPEIVRNDGSVLDVAAKTYPQIGDFFALFESGRYQKHQLGRFIPIPGRKIGVPVYVLTNDIVENFYFVVFTQRDNKVIVRQVMKGRDMAEFALTAEKNWASDKIRDLFRDLNQGSLSTAKAISTPGLFADIEKIGGWKRFKRDQRLDVEKINIATSVPLDGKSVRVVARVAFPVREGQMNFDIDFERMGAELRAVRARDTEGRDISADKEVDCFIAKRYGAATQCVEYKLTSTENPWFWSVERLVDYSRRAVEMAKPDQIEIYSRELKTILDTDDLRGQPLGLDATAKFLRGDYNNFYQLAKDAIEKNGEVYIPLVRRYSADMAAGNAMRPIILGLSVKGVRYIPSYEDRRQEQIMLAPSSIKSMRVFGDRPAVEVELIGQEEKDWRLFLPGTGCGTLGVPPQSRIPGQRLVVVAKSNPCGLLSEKIGDKLKVGGLLKSKDPSTPAFYAPANWPDVAHTLADLYAVLTKAWGIAPARK
ncbi:MAG TPA: hypothetical protein VFQ91_14065 [Bryobacteraceae bacterium]|nr:hypothetical protein [Bryobacteraceae bacterium]